MGILLPLLFLRLFFCSGQDYQTLLRALSPLHESCVTYLREQNFHLIYGGLLCADSRLPADTANLFKNTGLYHLLVVSGSHFVFLEQILNFLFKKKTKTKMVVFVMFGAVCQFNPPVTRSLMALILQKTSDHFSLFWRREQVALYSGFACLFLFPEWLLSPSLLLSWLAALALTFSRKSIWQHTLIFIFILPVFCNNSAFSVVNNILVAPLFGFFFFPMTFFTALVPYYGSLIGNWLWLKTFFLMSYLPDARTTQTMAMLPMSLLWLYTFSLHVLRRFLTARLRP